MFYISIINDLVEQQSIMDSLEKSSFWDTWLRTYNRTLTKQMNTRIISKSITKILTINTELTTNYIPMVMNGNGSGSGRSVSTITSSTTTMMMNSIIKSPPNNNIRIIRNSLLLHNQMRFASKKTDKPKVAGWDKSLKKSSKRLGKYYKMKTHKGAAQRWQVVGSSTLVGLKRAKCGQSHLRRKNRGWKKRALRERVLANAQQRNLLKKLLPYHAKKYSRL